MNPTHATYTTPKATFQDFEGNTVAFGPSRIIVEPLSSRHRSPMERAADRLAKAFIVSAALYLFAEIVRCFADQALVTVVR